MNEGVRGRHAILATLIVIYIFNYLDRQIVSILQVPIKQEFALADWQLGLMTGVAFSLVYSVVSLPIARVADAGVRRVTVIAVALAVWSVMTASCGAAISYAQLLMARAGVGVGEAGWAPSATSLIADLYPRRTRARAMGFFAAGIPIGSMIGLALGGFLAERLGWRAAIVIVGLPGLPIAIAVARWIPEPARGASDGQQLSVRPPVSLTETLRFMWAKSSYRHLLAALSLGSFVSAGLLSWFPPFFARSHGMSLMHIGLWWGGSVGLFGVIGMIGGGWLCDVHGAKDPRLMLRIPAIAFLIALPFHMIAITAATDAVALGCLIPPLIAGALWLAPNLAVTQALAPVSMRTTVTALSLLIGNVLGTAIGPLVVGFASDLITARTDAATGLRGALLIAGLCYGWAAFHFWSAAQTLGRDMAETEVFDAAYATSASRGSSLLRL